MSYQLDNMTTSTTHSPTKNITKPAPLTKTQAILIIVFVIFIIILLLVSCYFFGGSSCWILLSLYALFNRSSYIPSVRMNRRQKRKVIPKL